MFSTTDVVKRAYDNWIAENVAEGEDVGNCTLWARVMKQAFPELMLVSGFAEGAMFFGSKLPHYHEYLITQDGDIIDPTASQFDLLFGKGEWEYIRWEECLIV